MVKVRWGCESVLEKRTSLGVVKEEREKKHKSFIFRLLQVVLIYFIFLV